MHLWVQKFQPVLGLASGGRLLRRFQTPILHWINFGLRELSTLAAQNRESRIARFPEWRAWNRQKFRSEKHKSEWNRSKVESRKSIQNRHPNFILSMLKVTLESRDSNRAILNPDLLFLAFLENGKESHQKRKDFLCLPNP